ncbi:hypothetical protein FLAN108750_04680 [Flavobacterium antarcticum]|uniref:hypothetical protein n=1 Tax=Flavobacterium antarcticum TaxID=271155 RepID=UPI0003B54755|nr:hypothetical protein [Flavobacterium antarcticum]
MKKIFYFLFVLSLTSIAVSCSSDDALPNEAENPENPEVPGNTNLYKLVVKNFTVSTNAIFDSTTYQLENSKIKSTQRIVVATGVITSTQYSYTNDKISSIVASESGVIRSKQFFAYQNNKLSEFKTETYNLNNALTEISKHTFVQTGDTIYSEWKKSTDGTNYTVHSTSKLKLENGNTVFYEGNFGSDVSRIIMQFDSNGNPLTEKYFNKQQGENEFLPTGESTITYDAAINTFGKIMEATYGREVTMYLSHLESNAVNLFRVKKFARNTIKTFQSDSAVYGFEINNTINAENFAKKIEYLFFLDTELLTKFEQEFYFN